MTAPTSEEASASRLGAERGGPSSPERADLGAAASERLPFRQLSARGAVRAELVSASWETFSALLFASAILPEALRSPWPGALFCATLAASAALLWHLRRARGAALDAAAQLRLEARFGVAAFVRVAAWPVAFLPRAGLLEPRVWIPTIMFGLMAATMRGAIYRRELAQLPDPVKQSGAELSRWMRQRLGESAAMAGILGGHLLLLFSVAFLRAGSELLFRGWWQFLPALALLATLLYTAVMWGWTRDVAASLARGAAATVDELRTARTRLARLPLRLSRLNLALWLACTAAGVFYFRTGASTFREVDAVMQLLYAALFCWGVAHYQRTWDRATTSHVERVFEHWLHDEPRPEALGPRAESIRDRMLRAFGWPLAFAALLMLFSSVSLYRTLGGGLALGPSEEGAAFVALLAAFAMLVLAVGGVIARVATELSTPIGTLAEAAETIARGDLDAEVPRVGEPREVAQLVASMEKMRQNLAKTIVELEGERQNLEVKVADRTAELSRALQELREAQAALVQGERLASIGELVAGLAHEIGNPLNAVAGSAEPLEQVVSDVRKMLDAYRGMERHLPADRREHLEAMRAELDLESSLDDLVGISSVVRRATDRTVRIVQNLKNFSRSTQEAVPTNLEAALDETLALLASRLRQSCIQVSKDYGGLPDVTCRAGEMNQVFMNLSMNAVQALEGVGDPTVPGEDDAPREILVETRLEGSYAIVRLSDSGPGVSDDLKHKIFDPFFTTKPKGQGTGLGLSISVDLVRKHGGSLSMERGRLGGACFVVRLPLQPVGRAKKEAREREEGR
jgi:signal transduction histidine kinase